MGTQFRVVLYAPCETTAAAAAKAGFARIAQLDATMSDYKEESELNRLCREGVAAPMPISAELFEVLAAAQDVARRTDGAFDVTVGPLVRLWRRSRRQRELPDAETLKKAKALVGFEKLTLDTQRRTAKLAMAGMQLDLGGLAKGYAADEALAAIQKTGIDRALVAAGGDIRVGSPPPEKDGWTVGVLPLETPNGTSSRQLLLANAAVSTSGDAEQFVEINGTRYSHIVDPRTGLGMTGRSSVTVVAPRGLQSDSLDTAISVIGPEKGLQLIEATPGTAALMVRKKADGSLESFESTAWKRQLKPLDAPLAK